MEKLLKTKSDFCERLSSLLTTYVIIPKDRYNYSTIVLGTSSYFPLRFVSWFIEIFLLFYYTLIWHFHLQHNNKSSIIVFCTSIAILILTGWKKDSSNFFHKGWPTAPSLFFLVKTLGLLCIFQRVSIYGLFVFSFSFFVFYHLF